MRMWRNWQTRTFEGRVVYSIWVQVPSSAPKEERVPMVLSLLFFSMGLEGRAPAGSIAVRQNFGGRNSASQNGKCCVIGFAAPPAGKFSLRVKAVLSFLQRRCRARKIGHGIFYAFVSFIESIESLLKGSVEEGHDLTSCAGIVGREGRFGRAAGYAVRERPCDRLRIFRVGGHIGEGACAARARRTGVFPQICNG